MKLVCWTHKKECNEFINNAPYCPDCVSYIIELQNKILGMKKDELLDYSVSVGLTDDVKYSMTIDDIQIVVLDKLKMLI